MAKVKVSKENIEKKKSKAAKSFIPQDFSITPEMADWFDAQKFSGVVILSETQQFIDHWKAKGEMRSDWVATWRNWMRNAQKYSKRDAYGTRSITPPPHIEPPKEFDFANRYHEEL